jgi:hypothetical protein
VVAVAMDAGRRDQAAQCGEKLEGGEGEDGATVAGGSRREVDDLVDTGLAVWCGGGALDVEDDPWVREELELAYRAAISHSTRAAPTPANVPSKPSAKRPDASPG